jgi:general secretion pathway protein I
MTRSVTAKNLTLPWRGRVGSDRAKRDTRRGGVIVHPQLICPALLVAHPTPALRADPPPPGEGKRNLHSRFAGTRSNAEAGFTLLEVIVALAILALSLGVIFQTVSNAVGRTAQSEAVTHARWLAQSLLAQVGREIPVSTGETAGEDGHGHRWRLRQTPYGDQDDRAHRRVSVIEVSAEVFWGEGPSPRSIALTTLRLAPPTALPGHIGSLGDPM